ncbi:MAG: transposase zinc-binding domain-containing protein [Spirochaetia bacterium]
MRAASAFRVCGDWSQGIARIRCPACGFDRLRPFSCKSYLLCPSCAQKRTLLVEEYLGEDLLLRLPHRQFGWTIPKVLRVLLRHDRDLLSPATRRSASSACGSFAFGRDELPFRNQSLGGPFRGTGRCQTQ